MEGKNITWAHRNRVYVLALNCSFSYSEYSYSSSVIQLVITHGHQCGVCWMMLWSSRVHSINIVQIRGERHSFYITLRYNTNKCHYSNLMTSLSVLYSCTFLSFCTFLWAVQTIEFLHLDQKTVITISRATYSSCGSFGDSVHLDMLR